MEINEVDGAVSDAVAEIVNIVAGSAKARFDNGGKPIDLGPAQRDSRQRVCRRVSIWFRVALKSLLAASWARSACGSRFYSTNKATHKTANNSNEQGVRHEQYWLSDDSSTMRRILINILSRIRHL